MTNSIKEAIAQPQAPVHTRPLGAAVVSRCLAELSGIANTHPEWYAWFERVDPDLCSHSDLMELLDRAPTPMAQGFLMGKLTLRQSIAAITGRPML